MILGSSGAVAGAGGGGGSYTARAVHFDGATWLVNNALVSTDNGLWSSSGWFKFTSVNDTAPTIYVTDPENAQGGYVNILSGEIDTEGAFDFVGLTAGAAIHADPLPEVGQWFHILVSVDNSVDPNLGKIYINDVDVTSLLNSGVSTLTSNGLPFWVGSDSFEGDEFTGDASDPWIAPGVSLLVDGDIPEATRRKFISATGKPVNPSGFPPGAVLFSGNASTFAINQGSGGTFATTGTLTNATTSPSD